MKLTKRLYGWGHKVLVVALALVLALGCAPHVGALNAWAADSAPFSATVDATAITADSVTCTEDGYAYTDSVYAPTDPEADAYGYIYVSKTVNLYTVSVPAGTTQVSLDYGSNGYLTYVYDATGAFVSGSYADATQGETSATVSVLDNSGKVAFARVQDPYNADWTGGALQFAITWEIDGDSDDPEPTPTPDPESTDDTESTAGSYTSAKAATLISNLTARFAAGGDDASITNMTLPAAFALHAQGLKDSLDAEAIAEELAVSETGQYYSVGTLAKYVLALDAAGVDCTSVEVGGVTRDLVQEMVDKLGDGSGQSVWSAVYLLPALDAVTSDQTDLIDALVETIVAAQDENGYFSSQYSMCQTTAQAIMALQGHNQDAVCAKAKEALLEKQLNDGGFADNEGDTTSNLEASASVVYALAAFGVDCASVKSASGSTPLDYLVASADEGLASYEESSSATESTGAAEALLALVAYKGMTLAEGAFDAYVDVYPDEPAPISDDDTDSDADGKSGAQTGDANCVPFAVVGVALAGSLGTAVFARRKMNR